MNEGDFDKKISKTLKDDATNYPDMDKNWKKVVEKLAENQSSKPPVGGMLVLPNDSNGQSNPKSSRIPWLLAGMLLLLGSNGWLLWRLSQTNNSPKSAISGNYTAPQTLRLYDTIIETKVIYKIDTIYKKVIVNETFVLRNNHASSLNEDGIYRVNAPISSSVLIESKPMTSPNVSEQNSETIKQNHLSIIQVPVQPQPNSNTDSLNDNQHKVIQPKNDSVKIAAVPYDSLEMKPKRNIDDIIIKPSRKKFVIDHYGIGFQGGFSSELPSVKGVDIGYWKGLIGEIAFNKHYRLYASVDHSDIHYQTLTRNPILDLPNNPPMTENYNLKYIEGNIPSWFANMGLSYFFKPEAKTKPFITVGYAHRWILPSIAEFEFTNKLTNEEKSFKVEKEGHQDNWISLGLGIERPLLPNLFGQLKMEYVYDPNHGGNSLNYVILRGGAFYRF